MMNKVGEKEEGDEWEGDREGEREKGRDVEGRYHC